MKRIVYLVAAATMILFTAGCSGGNAGRSPKDIEKAIYNKLQKGNYEKAVEMLFENVESDDDTPAEQKAEVMKAFTEKTKQSADAKGGLKSFEILEEKISEDGKTATVTTKVTYGDGTEDTQNSTYVNKDGVWKLIMNK